LATNFTNHRTKNELENAGIFFISNVGFNREKQGFSIKKMRGCKIPCFSTHFLDIENLQD